MRKRESLCRLCGERLSYKGPDGNIHWEYGCVDDKGLICENCRVIVKLQAMREEKEKEDG